MNKLRVLFVVFISILFLVTDINAQDKVSNPLTTENIELLRQITILRDSLTQIRKIAFDNIPVNDMYKTSGIIQELLNRSEQQIFNMLPKGRFVWSWDGFEQPKDMVVTAGDLIRKLSEGKDPFVGKYAEPGGYTVDHALIKKDGVTHLFYIRGTAVTNWPEYPLFNFGHAVSTDLKNWKIENPVLQCPKSGWDQYQVWAPHIIEHNGTYYMFYTGVNQQVAQAICIATSTDLYHWERYEKNPVITTGKWGIWNSNEWSDCRDPVVLKDGKTFYLYYTAMHVNSETNKPENCIGISSSTDLYNWKDEGFFRLTNSLLTPPESPFVLKHNGTYYMLYTSYKYGTVYLTSKDPVKGWLELPVDKMVLMTGVSASEVYEDNGKYYMSYISHQKNGLHFFEIAELIWNNGGSISLKPLKQ